MNNNSKYLRLVSLARKTDSIFTVSETKEINIILSDLDVDDIEPKDKDLIDDLISIMYNTNNIYKECNNDINKLLSLLRNEKT